jgi:transposase-like protein
MLEKGPLMANRTNRTPEKDAKFFEFLSQGASVTAAARAAGYTRSRVYEWRKADAEFAAAWDDSLGRGTDLLEDEALRRAMDGVEEPRFAALGAQPDVGRMLDHRSSRE